MDPNTPIEDLDLTVRAYNGLKRREIHTLGDLFGCLDRGIECALPFAKMGHRTAETILVIAREQGYPVRDRILQHLILLRRNPETGERELRFWEEMAERIQRVVPNTPEELAKHPGTLLRDLGSELAYLSRHLSREGIVTVEELLQACPTYEDLPGSEYVKDALLRELDKKGYRIAECSKERWPDLEKYLKKKKGLPDPDDWGIDFDLLDGEFEDAGVPTDGDGTPN